MQQIEKEGLLQVLLAYLVQLPTKQLLRGPRYLAQLLLHLKQIHLAHKQVNLYSEHKQLLQALVEQIPLLLEHKEHLPLGQAHPQLEDFLVQNLKQLLVNQLVHPAFHLVKLLQHQVLLAAYSVHRTNHLA